MLLRYRDKQVERPVIKTCQEQIKPTERRNTHTELLTHHFISHYELLALLFVTINIQKSIEISLSKMIYQTI